MIPLKLEVNGQPVTTEVAPATLLIDLLRGPLGLTGTHAGCDTSQCGACTVLIDGESIKSCSLLAVQAAGRRITTVEGLATGDQLHPVQQAFMDCHGLQCGFCTPGMMMTGRALLDENPHPSDDEIREAISGQICRCTGYKNIVASIQWAADNPATSEVNA